MKESPWLSFYDPQVPAQIDFPNKTLVQVFEDIALQFPSAIAIHFFSYQQTYRRLHQLVNQFANLLFKNGFQPGMRVALYLPNVPAVPIVYYGALKAGAVITQLNPLYSSTEAEFQLKDSDAQYLVVLDRFLPLIQTIQGHLKLKKIWVCGIQDFLPFPLNRLYQLKSMREKTWVSWRSTEVIRPFSKELRTASSECPSSQLSLDAPALFQYTGGTTGIAKGVILTHRNLLANALQVRHWFPTLKQGEEKILAVIPIFHCYGMTVGMNLSVVLGASMILLPKFDVQQVMEAIQKYKPSLFPGVQAMYVAINQHPKTPRYNLKSVKACISGAGPLHQEVQKKFEEITGGKLVEGYGLTEASPVTHANPIYGQRKMGSIGIPLSGTESKIVDLETGQKDLASGEIGELVIRGPQVMQGYLNHPEETQWVLRDGWLYTGDIAYMDDEGFFFVVDRKKDMIKVGGENVYPRDVEEVLFQNDKIKDCVVVGIPDSSFVERVKAYVVLKSAMSATESEIIEFCKLKMAKYKVPREVEFRQELPKNLVGKNLRRVLVHEANQKNVKSGNL